MSAAPALRLSLLGELEARGPGVGFMVYRPDVARSFELTSYNPRRYADSRRWWARVKRAQLDAAPATSLLTTTLPAEFHERQIDRETIAHEAGAHRRFLQTLNRLVVHIDAGDVCWECLRKYRDAVRENPRARFSPCRKNRCAAHRKPWHGAIGNCAHCASWTHVRWYAAELDQETGQLADPRGAWLCSNCAGARAPGRPRIRLAWIREPGKSLQHLHRHAKFDGPFIPQWLLSALASRAGLGRVLDVRRFRPQTIDQAPVHEYLTKTAGARALDPLSSYFVKAASRPDEFNALPKGIPRCRAPRPPRPSSTNWYFSRFDPRVVTSSWEEPAPAEAAPWSRAPGCVCRDESNCQCGAEVARQRSATSSAPYEHFFPAPKNSGKSADFEMLSASSQAVPRGERGAVSEACGSREAIDSAFQFMTETKERFELSIAGRARAPDDG